MEEILSDLNSSSEYQQMFLSLPRPLLAAISAQCPCVLKLYVNCLIKATDDINMQSMLPELSTQREPLLTEEKLFILWRDLCESPVRDGVVPAIRHQAHRFEHCATFPVQHTSSVRECVWLKLSRSLCATIT